MFANSPYAKAGFVKGNFGIIRGEHIFLRLKKVDAHGAHSNHDSFAQTEFNNQDNLFGLMGHQLCVCGYYPGKTLSSVENILCVYSKEGKQIWKFSLKNSDAMQIPLLYTDPSPILDIEGIAIVPKPNIMRKEGYNAGKPNND